MTLFPILSEISLHKTFFLNQKLLDYGPANKSEIRDLCSCLAKPVRSKNMSEFKPVESSFIVRNISNRVIKALGKVPLNPSSQPRDLFKTIPGLSESAVLEALQAPNGKLYKDIFVNRNLKIESYNLMHLNNLHIKLDNLVTSNKPTDGQILSVVKFLGLKD